MHEMAPMQMQARSVLMKEGGVVFQTLRKTKASLERQRPVGSWSKWRKSFSKGPQAGEVAGVPGDAGRQGSKKAGSGAANRPECALHPEGQRR